MSKLIEDAEIATRGIELLSRNLGPADTHRFLTLLRPTPTDYVKVSRRLYGRQVIDAIVARSRRRARRRANA